MDDFIHKLKVCLKELRETRRWARLVERRDWLPGDPQLAFVLKEAEELIRIFKASVRTAERNRLGHPQAHKPAASSYKAK
jgi:four helix bundle protein